MAERSYRIRASQAGANGTQTVYRLTVPPDIARQLDPTLEFTVELTDEGLLYRPADATAKEPELPSWAKGAKRKRA